MKGRFFLIVLLAFFSTSAHAQLTGTFRLAKAAFAAGEPVFLYLDLVNKGSDPAELVIGDPDQPFCSGVEIHVSSDNTAPGSTCPFPRDAMCTINGQIHKEELQPGRTYTYRFLLNFKHEINAPGNYWVEAKWIGFMIPTAVENTEARLEFRVDTEPVDSTEWKPWLEQLRAPESEKRQEAAKVLAGLAPLSLEETLLGFADNPAFRRYAPLAYHRLNTERSLDALVQFLEGPLTNERPEAALYLAATNDRKWYPLLRDTAGKSAADVTYLISAAELGGEDMLPMLVALARSPDPAHLNAVAAMGSTGSRAAIPILIPQILSPDVDVSDRANYALQILTHRTAIQGSLSRRPQDEYLKWSRWWEGEGASARIYKDSECGQVVPLP